MLALLLLLLGLLGDLTLGRLPWCGCCLTGLRRGGGLWCLVLLLHSDPLSSRCLRRLWGGLGGMLLALIPGKFIVDINSAPM